MREPKQVIVIRKDLGMSPGKMVAQGAHASMKVFLDEGKIELPDLGLPIFSFPLQPEMKNWIEGSFVKIILGVHSENELLNIYTEAQNAGLPRSIIKDQARTEISKPEYTAVAIGPADPDRIDEITGDLFLL